MQPDLFSSHSSHLILRLDALIAANERTLELLVDRREDFANHWPIPIHRVFYTALDIRATPVIYARIRLDQPEIKHPPGTRFPDGVEAKSLSMLKITQGSNFSFAAEDVLYDSPGAYSETWAEALKHFKFRISISQARSATRTDPGDVQYDVHENIEGSLVKTGRFKSTQHDFVRALILGMDAILTGGRIE